MDVSLLQKQLGCYFERIAAYPDEARADEKERRADVLFYSRYTQKKILSMTEEDFYHYIAPLWAMRMWGNKQYQVNNILEANGLEFLKKQLASLIWGEETLAKRWDAFRTKVKGMGPAIMSELLCKTFPDKYLLWNRKAYNGFRALGIPDLPRYEARLDGKKYEYLVKCGHDILAQSRGSVFRRSTICWC